MMSRDDANLGMDESYSSSCGDSDASNRGKGADSPNESNGTAAAAPTTAAAVVPTQDAQIARGARVVVMLVLLLSAATVAALAYKQLSDSEHAVFKAQFESSAQQILYMAKKNAANVFVSFEALANLYPLSAQQTGETLPFVTIQDFEAIASNMRQISRVTAMSYAPLLRTQAELDAWAVYSANHSSWIADGREYRTTSTTFAGPPPGVTGSGSGGGGGGDGPPPGVTGSGGGPPPGVTGGGSDGGPPPGVTGTGTGGPPSGVTGGGGGGPPPGGTGSGTGGPPSNSTGGGGQPSDMLYTPYVYTLDTATRRPIRVTGPGLRAPIWQMSPVPGTTMMVNFDNAQLPALAQAIDYMIETSGPSLTTAQKSNGTNGMPIDGAASTLLHPVFDGFVHQGSNRTVVGYVSAVLSWKFFFEEILPADKLGIDVVVESCGTLHTYRINGPKVEFLGDGSIHETKYNDMGKPGDVISLGSGQVDATSGKICAHSVTIYPTSIWEDSYKSNKPIVYALVVVAIFCFAALVFHAYDWFVTNRQNRTEIRADKSSAIVEELFPGEVAAQLYGSKERKTKSTTSSFDANHANGDYMQGGGNGGANEQDNLIADLYTETTVLFADIAGFTAWSSTRDPDQVFKLLEAIFQAFDVVAKKLGVFKVETIGDCYVAVCGVPKPNAEHAVVMCNFARSALTRFRSICRKLELTLGPDTADLALRVGMHSGPVTAGVLRGERARFQLFGDTMNTASRIESTGQRDRIHLSEQTAAELTKHGKEHWIVQRDDIVTAKGKGELVTYWLKPRSSPSSPASVAPSECDLDSDLSRSSHHGNGHNVRSNGGNAHGSNNSSSLAVVSTMLDSKSHRHQRLVHWNCELLLNLLRRVVTYRVVGVVPATTAATSYSPQQLVTMARQMGTSSSNSKQLVVHEVVDTIDMPEFVLPPNGSVVEVNVAPNVEAQLRKFVATIASMYQKNAFHNFEHASHVAMSVSKLLGRIATTKADDLDHQNSGGRMVTDPLTQFAVILSALIHDVDHQGVSNAQLLQQDPTLAQRYHNQSVAEQNSIDVAWNVLTKSENSDLCATIFTTEAELRRFRSLLVNSIIATDIFDKELSLQRKNRWDAAAFGNAAASAETSRQQATIVIEHLLQASDVSHTMQHWHIYQKWNQRLFDEMMTAYRKGRSDKDPSLGWYDGELWFFDHYVIPLAHKLKECGVFGVSGDEYLTYAQLNRKEWQTKGRAVVQQYVMDFTSTTSSSACNATSATSSALEAVTETNELNDDDITRITL